MSSFVNVFHNKRRVVSYVPLLKKFETSPFYGMREEEIQCIIALTRFCDEAKIEYIAHHMKNGAESIDFSTVYENTLPVVICGPKNNKAVFRFFDRQETFRFYESRNEETEGQWIFATNGTKFYGTNKQVNYAFVGKVVLEAGMPECLLIAGMHGEQSLDAVRYICEEGIILESGEWQLLRFDKTKSEVPEVYVEAKGKAL